MRWVRCCLTHFENWHQHHCWLTVKPPLQNLSNMPCLARNFLLHLLDWHLPPEKFIHSFIKQWNDQLSGSKQTKNHFFLPKKKKKKLCSKWTYASTKYRWTCCIDWFRLHKKNKNNQLKYELGLSIQNIYHPKDAASDHTAVITTGIFLYYCHHPMSSCLLKSKCMGSITCSFYCFDASGQATFLSSSYSH